MVRILLFADTHLGFDHPVRPRAAVRRRGPDFFRNYERVLDHARDQKFDLVIHGGDLFTRSRVHERITDLAYGTLLEFAEHGIPIVIVPGNHERSRLPSSLCFGHPNIHIFHEPSTFFFDIASTRVAIAGFPFERKDIRGRFREVVDETGHHKLRADLRLLCLHQAVEGATVGPSDYTFRRGRDVIRRDDIPDAFHLVLAGHIHRRQILARPRADGSVQRIIYPGSVERTSFAERHEPKGFYEITIRDPAALDLNFVELPTRPMTVIELNGELSGDSLVPYLESQAAEMHPDSVVRLRCGDTVEEGVRERLDGRLIRAVFPPTMSVDLERDFFGRKSDPPARS